MRFDPILSVNYNEEKEHTSMTTEYETEPISENLNPNRPSPDMLNNWVNERPFLRPSERRVRRQVANAMLSDITHPDSEADTPPRLRQYRQNLAETTHRCAQALESRGISPEAPLRHETTDSVTGEPVVVQYRRTDNGWISEELTEEGVRSRAEVFDNGNTKLTMHYADARYAQRNALLTLEADTTFPTATRAVFVAHAAASGLIPWKIK